MDFSLILFILGFIFIAYLIFKLIKKIIFAIITFVVFVILIIGSVFGLVYLDYNYLKSQSDFNIHIIYGNSQDAKFGLVVPVENSSLNFESSSSYKISDLSNVDLDNLDTDFYLFFSEKLINEILDDQASYYIQGTQKFEILKIDLDTKLNKNQVLNIFSAKDEEDAKNIYIKEILSQNNVPEILQENAQKIADSLISKNLEDYDITLRQALFLTILNQSLSESKTFIKFVEGFKEKKLQVYPDRFTFKLVRMLQVDTIISFIPESLIN